ncbi:glycosyltransferase [Actinokineospora cianjurensis]|uniref:Galactofuranosylgalactofuranosylrhamnosyl-N-acetylglucosaminyl-diphospho-decaprenol beta-1,5/1,6-galactofuranosyltransferase n=1 Tax=Actinokineospora cianjurensis TaxID=585224 RepID=A0A421B6H9_9PSEU|nr:glycosyltransferase [Actinokineospora cianjurensis]RLK60051.1 galactofuranosylgalactofuranosylrhamnosyl-N-acetylglucosaminyl-diphospho-decaprenol beta-1,5/1,6-galactofuranosyltransferase [Actinokineospora cianjurensis]
MTRSAPSATAAPEAEPTAPAARLVAQRGLFRGPDPVCPDALYTTVVSGAAERERARITVQPFSAVSTDTYFGRFPASHWQRWTVVTEVTVELVVSGSAKIALVASDFRGETRPEAATDVRGATDQLVTLTAKLDKFLDGGFLWVEIDTEDTGLAVDRLVWTVAGPETYRQTSVVICTFNRADDCTRTLGALAGDEGALEVLDAVYVVDQGTDTVQSRPQFNDLDNALGGRLRYLRQPNLGGAGGFGRGMYEITKSGESNILLMDDDVLCEPEIAVRLSAFANRTQRPTLVGGQMLRLLHPTRLIASAEYADFNQLIPGQVVHNGLDDVDLLEPALDGNGEPTGQPVRGDRRVEADYNAWWSCLIPNEVARELGLPLPVFFQWDDVEYGYRARSRGYNTVTLPGAGLWHADFDWKDGDKWNEYFAVRNAMIVATLHSAFPPKQVARVITSRVARALLAMQYGFAVTMIKAAEDFLEGPRALHDGGQQAAADIRKLRAEYADTVAHPIGKLGELGLGSVPLIQAAPAPKSPRLVLLKRLAHLATGRSTHPVGAVPSVDSAWWHVSQFDKVVVTDAAQDAVRVRTRDKATTIELAKRAAQVARRIIAEGPRLQEEYRAAVPALTDKDNWERLYGLR